MDVVQLKVTGWSHRDIQAAILRSQLEYVRRWLSPLGKARNKQHNVDDLVQMQVEAALKAAKLSGQSRPQIRVKIGNTWYPETVLDSFGRMYCPDLSYYALFCSQVEPKDYSYSKGAYYLLFTGGGWTDDADWELMVSGASKEMTCLKVTKDERATITQIIQAICPAVNKIVPFQS